MAPSPQMDMLFLAVTVLASVASVSFFVGYLAHRSGRPTHATAASIVGLSATWYWCVRVLRLGGWQERGEGEGGFHHGEELKQWRHVG